MEDEEGLTDWIEIDRIVFNSVFGIDNYENSIHKIESVRRLGEVGIHVTYYNRNKIIHNYGK